MRTTRTVSEAETSEAGRALASELRAGEVLLIEGPLAAGKTAFVRGLAEGLGVDPAEVSSPTFTLVQQYGAVPELYHADLYRLTSVEVEDLGLDEACLDGILAVEWPDRWTHRPTDAWRVVIEDLGGDERRISIYSTR